MGKNLNSVENLGYILESVIFFYRECRVFYGSIKLFIWFCFGIGAEVSGKKESYIWINI